MAGACVIFLKFPPKSKRCARAAAPLSVVCVYVLVCVLQSSAAAHRYRYLRTRSSVVVRTVRTLAQPWPSASEFFGWFFIRVYDANVSRSWFFRDAQNAILTASLVLIPRFNFIRRVNNLFDFLFGEGSQMKARIADKLQRNLFAPTCLWRIYPSDYLLSCR